MKRIGILTYHCIPNFGAQLQALSTIGYLKNHGYEPIMLNWYPKDLEEFYLKRAYREQNVCQFEFAQHSMPVSKLCRTISDLCCEIERLHIDGVVLGSDALFDYTPECLRYNFSFRKLKKFPIQITSNHTLPNPFWGSFNDYLKQPLPIVGISISSQNMPFSKLKKSEKEELKRLLLGFKTITSRDEWTKNLITYISGRTDVSITPDPVFAFNQNTDFCISREHICKKYNIPEKYILVSFLYEYLSDEFVNRIIEIVEMKTEAKCVSFPMPDRLRKFNTKYIINLPLNPIDWYYLIKYSQGYIGERMHPIVVSLHNSVPFFCFDQYGTNKIIIPRVWTKFIPESSKIYDILQKADLISNMCFYSQKNNVSPEYVVEHFLSFDKDKCSAFAQKEYKLYSDGMDKLMKYLLA